MGHFVNIRDDYNTNLLQITSDIFLSSCICMVNLRKHVWFNWFEVSYGTKTVSSLNADTPHWLLVFFFTTIALLEFKF